MFTRYIFVLLICIIAVCCHHRLPIGQVDRGTNSSFTLINAKAEKWMSPLPGGDGGAEYYFQIVINTSHPLSFDSCWINNSSYPVFIVKQSAGVSNEQPKYGKGDTIFLRISVLQNMTMPPKSPPLSYDGDALISYKLHGVEKYFVIEKIEVITTPQRQ